MPVKRIVLVGTVALALTCLCVAMGQATTLVALRSPGWRYKLFPDAIPPEVFTVGYDDSQWATGVAPFVGAGGCLTPGSNWPGFRVVFRKHFFWGGDAGPTIFAQGTAMGDGHVDIWMDGVGPSTFGGASGQTVCPDLNVYSISQGCPLRQGDNVIVVYVAANPGLYFEFFDARVVTDAVVPVQQQTWGQLKVVYR